MYTCVCACALACVHVCDATVASFRTHPIPAIPVIRIGNLNPHTHNGRRNKTE